MDSTDKIAIPPPFSHESAQGVLGLFRKVYCSAHTRLSLLPKYNLSVFVRNKRFLRKNENFRITRLKFYFRVCELYLSTCLQKQHKWRTQITNFLKVPQSFTKTKRAKSHFNSRLDQSSEFVFSLLLQFDIFQISKRQSWQLTYLVELCLRISNCQLIVVFFIEIRRRFLEKNKQDK